MISTVLKNNYKEFLFTNLFQIGMLIIQRIKATIDKTSQHFVVVNHPKLSAILAKTKFARTIPRDAIAFTHPETVATQPNFSNFLVI